MKRRTVFSLIMLLCLGFVLSGCTGSEGSEEESGVKSESFTVWMGKAEDQEYYSEYEDSPVVQYYLKDTYVGTDWEQVSISLDFQVPAAGSESDNFNTLLATGDYQDIMELLYYTGSISDLYKEGIALDLTEYVENYMPNYKAYLEKNPQLAMTATNPVDGEKKYLSLYSYNTNVVEWQGFVYRRDWILKYGKNPVTSGGFSGGYSIQNDDGSWNLDSWEDDIVFPSGGPDPIYISDWEWMFGIFEEAMADLGIDDGYCLSIGSAGYSRSGLLVSSFGGNEALWYKGLDGNVEFGADSDNFRTYLQAMHTWFDNGWIDKSFYEHTSDYPWRIDEAKVRSGKVGLWHGMDGQLFNRMNLGDALTQDIMVFACPYPINDVYGGEDQQYKEPYCLFQGSLEGKPFMITDKAKGKDLVALFTYIDTLYAEENSVRNSYGLSKEEVAETQNPLYIKWGLEDGAYVDSGEKTDDGRALYLKNDIVAADSGSLVTAISGGRFFGLIGDSPTAVVVNGNETEQFRRMRSLWYDTYKNTGQFPISFKSQLTSEEGKEISKNENRITEFLAKTIPTFVFGDKNPYDDAEWDKYINALSKYQPAKNTELYQQAIDRLK